MEFYITARRNWLFQQGKCKTDFAEATCPHDLTVTPNHAVLYFDRTLLIRILNTLIRKWGGPLKDYVSMMEASVHEAHDVQSTRWLLPRSEMSI